jgi:Dolichyl-phosphate-mannose-protein mannosyltransferase
MARFSRFASVPAQLWRNGVDGLRSAETSQRAVAWAYAFVRFTVTWLPLVMAIGLGTVLRLWQLNAIGYNTDEAVYSGQAAAIAQDPALSAIFPVFRAHPLLFQFVLAVVYNAGVSDLAGRLVAVGIGMATILLAYLLGRLLYGHVTGLLAAAILALMPYHVVISRQVLLDGPMAFLATLTLYLMAKFATSQRAVWLYAAGGAMGLTFLAKETGIVLLGAVYAFLALRQEIKFRIRDLVISTATMFLVIAPFPLSLLLAGGGGTERTKQYLVWQLFRRPNHTVEFYVTTVGPSIGLLVVGAAIVGLVLMRRKLGWQEVLLAAWVVVPFSFFQLWPVKGFQYLLPIAPPMALLAARALTELRLGWVRATADWAVNLAWLRPLAIAAVLLSLTFPTLGAISPSPSSSFLAGSGGVPGGREAGAWIDANTPAGTHLMTIGPSMANILQFYGHREASGLSVSPNPLQRNPAYEPLNNPDLLIRNNDLQYVVWDSYSAARSDFFANKLLTYVRRYNGRAVHTETVTVRSADGVDVAAPVIVIYEVRP